MPRNSIRLNSTKCRVLIEFENPSSKPFKVEMKVFRDGQLVRTEQSDELKGPWGE